MILNESMVQKKWNNNNIPLMQKQEEKREKGIKEHMDQIENNQQGDRL